MHHLAAFVVLAGLSSVAGSGLSWTYDTGSSCNANQPCSPSSWGSVSSKCSAYYQQSPINIASGIVELDTFTQGPLIEDYIPCSDWIQFVTEGSVFKVDMNDLCDVQLLYNNLEFMLKSIEIHSPSEHTLGGGHLDGEVQLIHFNNETKSTFVVSIFLQAGSSSITGNSNTFLETLWEAADYDATNYNVTVSGSSRSLDPYSTLFPNELALFHYYGTRTTPPCDPVEWYVFEQPVTVSFTDIEFLRSLVSLRGLDSLSSYGNNNRPIQPLLGRQVGYLPGGAIPSYQPSSNPTKKPTAIPTRAPTVFIHPGPYKVKVKSAMIVACLALSLTGIVLVAVVIWQIYTAFIQKDWSEYRRLGELETSLPV